jgi:hypothetical protein
VLGTHEYKPQDLVSLVEKVPSVAEVRKIRERLDVAANAEKDLQGKGKRRRLNKPFIDKFVSTI